MDAEPFREYTTEVRPEWIDYNNHMTDSAYAAVASEATEVFLATLGLSADYQAATGCTTYTAETHIYFKKEAALGARITVETVLVDTDPKRIRLRHTLATPDGPIATVESLYLHVNQHTGRVEPFPADRQHLLNEITTLHKELS
ncbi:thioesterase family protein [Actinocrispum sp. NPDC049592]|uniref:thioesterase family protein n=1 Tax=Actinocrispum sp. NPDC049592 TaxID=3154835 RepID=UPI00342FE28E